MTTTIRAALDAAAQAMCREAKSCHGDCGDRCAWREADVSMPACAAAAVAAFLRALPNGQLSFGITPITTLDGQQAAAAVERAAKEAGDG